MPQWQYLIVKGGGMSRFIPMFSFSNRQRRRCAFV